MKKAILSIFFLVIFPSFTLAQTDPAAIVSSNPKQSTSTGAVNEKLGKMLNGIMNMVRVSFLKLEMIDQKIIARIAKLTPMILPANPSLNDKLNNQQKDIATSLDLLKKDLSALETKLQLFASSSPTKNDVKLLKNELKNFNKKMKEVHKQELSLVGEMKKARISTGAGQISDKPVRQ